MYTPFTPPVPAEAERSRARVPTLAPGGACLMTSVTKNASVSALECAVAKSLDLKCLGMNTYKKRWGEVPAGELPLEVRTTLPPLKRRSSEHLLECGNGHRTWKAGSGCADRCNR